MSRVGMLISIGYLHFHYTVNVVLQISVLRCLLALKQSSVWVVVGFLIDVDVHTRSGGVQQYSTITV